MTKKNITKITGYTVPVVALGVGAFFGLESATGLETGLNMAIAGILTILVELGVIQNNDD